MRYNLEFIEDEIILTADKQGRFQSIEKLLEDVVHLKSLYKVCAVRVNNTNGEKVEVQKLSSSEVAAMIDEPLVRKCPDCNVPMVDGFCYSSDKLKKFWSKNFPAQDLIFEDLDEQAFVVVKDDRKQKAFRCKDCGITLIS